MKRLLTLFIVCILSTVYAFAYTWTDGNGVTWTWSTYSYTNDNGQSATGASLTGMTGNSADVIIPDYVYNGSTAYPVVYLDRNANLFWRRTDITSVKFPSTLKSMYDYYTSSTIDGIYYYYGVFAHCTNLTTVDFNNYKFKIGDDAFYGCPKLANLENSSHITRIGSAAFNSCSALTSIPLPAATYIGYDAFRSCSALTSVSLPAATSIDPYAFSYCSALTSISLPAATSIGQYSFEHCRAVTSVYIPSVTSIGEYAFQGCDALTSVSLPSITSIGRNAFRYCSELEKAYCSSATPAALGVDIFAAFATIIVPDEALTAYRTAWADYASQILPQSALEYKVAKTTATDGHPALLNAIGGVGKEADVYSLKVEGTINGYDIMLIRNKLLNLRYLDLSDATIVPEKDNYQYYTGYYTKENELGAYSFYDADHLRTIVLPKNITSIGSNAFAQSNLVEVTGMPDCCTSIGSNAFYKTSHLQKVEIGQGVTFIPSYCFYYSGIPTIELPNNLQSISYDAFFGCSNLKDLRLPPSLKEINSSAFYNCTSLTEIHVPSMLERIYDSAFYGCSAVKDVYAYTLSPTPISQNTFPYDGVTLHAPQVPEEIFWGYYKNTQWSQFTNVMPFEAKYELWFTGEDQDIVLGDGETIPNEDDDNEASGEMRPGSCLEYLNGAYQWLDKLIMQWTGGKYPSLIDNEGVVVDELTFDLKVDANKWYFFCFPFDIDLSKCHFPSNKHVWRYYDGDIRAKEGSGAWKDVPDGKLKAFEGYIFRTNNNGNIKMVVEAPMFSGSNKRINLSSHGSDQIQDAGWNFVGNPFLSYYDLGNFVDKFDMAITVWDPVNNTYQALMPGDDDYEFHPFEAFFVQKPTGVDKMTFEAEGRMGYNEATATLQSRRRARAARMIDPARRLVNLEISDGTYTDKTRVVFNDDHRMNYEAECDAAKFVSETSTAQIYSYDSNGVQYAINERPNADNTVCLGFTVAADGVYTISAPRMDIAMALMDKQTGTLHSFADGDYEFLAMAGTYNDRFVLVADQQAAGLNALLAEGIKVEAQDGGINMAGIEGKTAYIYNAAGQLVSVVTASGRTEVNAGTYVVKVGEASTKVVVR